MQQQRNLSFHQFDPGAVGPTKARETSETDRGIFSGRSGPEQRRRRVEGHQQRLFSVSGSDYMLEPHQQTREQFANDPRSWWHGRYSEQLPRTGGQRNAGVHVGSFGSSDKRRRDLGPSRKFKGTYDNPQPWRSFPVRLRGEHSNTPTEGLGRDEGARWNPKGGIHYYENRIEDPGSISALVPSRENLLTHSQSIKEAKAQGKYVHPMIQWESKMLKKDYDPKRQDPAVIMGDQFKARQNSELSQGQLFSTAGYNEGRQDAVARRRKTAIDAGIKDYASYAVHGNNPFGTDR